MEPAATRQLRRASFSFHRPCRVPPDEPDLLAGDIPHRLQQRRVKLLHRSVVFALWRYQRIDYALMQPLGGLQEAVQIRTGQLLRFVASNLCDPLLLVIAPPEDRIPIFSVAGKRL